MQNHADRKKKVEKDVYVCEMRINKEPFLFLVVICIAMAILHAYKIFIETKMIVTTRRTYA